MGKKSKISIFISIFSLMLSLALSGQAVAQIEEPPQPEVEMMTVTWADVGEDDSVNPCDENLLIQVDGVINYTFINVEVETPDGVEHEVELIQLHGSAVGMDNEGNAYMARLDAHVTECGDGECQVAHGTFRSPTAPNFTVTYNVLSVQNGQVQMEIINATCESTGRIAP